MRTTHYIGLAAVVFATTVCGGGGYGGGSPTAPNGSGGNAGGNNPYGNPGTTGDGSCTPTASTVCLTASNSFDPATITITRGQSVTWTNGSGITHNVTFSTPGAPGNIANFASGSHALTFPDSGTFAYNCTIHGIAMSGKVVVQ